MAALSKLRPSPADFLVWPILLGCAALLVTAAIATLGKLPAGHAPPLSLDPAMLSGYAARTVLRMAGGLVLSLVFTLLYAAAAAKSRRAGIVLIPLLDVLQSVPVLGYLSFTVVFFTSLFPGRVLGAELAAIFAIFTSQAWNMTFSLYQSLRTVPVDLLEAARSFRFPAWQRFWRVELPFALPGLVWNVMMSLSGGWFFLVAAEAIAVGDRQVALPGIGSYIALAIARADMRAVFWAIGAMAVVILVYDQLVLRPLVVWADHFRVEQTSAGAAPRSWFVRAWHRARFAQAFEARAGWAARRALRLRLTLPHPRAPGWLRDTLWYGVAAALLAWVTLRLAGIFAALGWAEIRLAVFLGLLTLLRVLAVVAVAALVWIPLGVLIGLRPRVASWVQPAAQFLAAFPANLLFPLVVAAILAWQLDPDLWLTLLLLLGTQWYILFNVIAGATAYPTELIEAARIFRYRGWQWWRIAMLPGIFPYIVTGAITAAGGAWNASIVAEAVSWGQARIAAHGLGAYIAESTAAGDFPRILLGIAVMSGLVVLLNRVLWRPLYAYAELHMRLG